MRRLLKSPSPNGVRHDGFTLVELMIVVAIVAVLAVVAVVAYSRYVTKGRMVDATNMVGQIQLRQESYFEATGTYCNASSSAKGCTKGSPGAPAYYPSATCAFDPLHWDPTTDGYPAWEQLGIASVEKGRTFFSFITAAGVSANSYAQFGDAAALGLAAGQPWYYIKACADIDGKGTPNATITATSLRRTAWTNNEDR